MLDARALREGIDVLTASLGVTLPEVTKKRHISRLERTSGAAVDQVRLSEAKNALASRAPSSERFRACCDGLAAHPDERDALLVCLWDLARNTNQMETSPGKAENVPSSANVQRPTLNVAQPAGADRKQDNPSDHRYADYDQSSFLDSSFMDVSNSMELLSPLEAVPGGHRTPAARRRSPLADSSPVLHINPMFSDSREDLGRSPKSTSQPTRPPMPSAAEAYVVTAAVTLPDAGNLFQPMSRVIAESSPEHMRKRAAELCLSTTFLDRPYLTGDWVLTAAHDTKRADERVQRLEGRSEAEQEALLVDDLLDAFMGLATEYFELVPMAGPDSELHIVYCLSRFHGQHCDASLCEQVQRLLHIPESVLLTSRYVESRLACEFGSVCNAFAEAVRMLLDDWMIFVTKLEHSLRDADSRLAMLTYYCDQMVPSLHLTATVCAEASAAQAAGADLLNLLHARSKTIVGSARSSRLLQQLLAAAAAPYFEVLTRWVAAGVLNDPFSEFMVVAVPGMRTDAELNGESAFWAGGHRLRTRAGDGGAEEPDMPAFLEEVQDEVLKAGKHWSILRQCQERGAEAPGALDVADNIDEDAAVDYDPKGHYLQAIRTHYQRAGTALLTLMLTHFDLRQWLGTCKNFFLLYQSDFLTNFLDSAMEELGKEAGKTSVARLRSLLEIAIRTSSLYREPHADQLLLTLDSRSFSELHTMLFKSSARKARTTKNVSKIKSAELLMLQISIQWPLSIVLSPRSMRMYQFCFRHLLNCKVVEGKLGETWKQLTRARMLRFRKPEEQGAQRTLMRVLLLINRMLVFVQRYLHFVTVEVIDPQWHIMMTKIADAASIDEVIELHSRCLLNIMRFGLMERLKALSMVAIITWTSREACGRIAGALARHCGGHAPAEVTADMLLAIVRIPDFVEGIDRAERDFTEGVEKLHAELKAHKYAVQSGTSTDRQVEADMIQNFIDQISIKHFSPAGQVMREAVRHLARH